MKPTGKKSPFAIRAVVLLLICLMVIGAAGCFPRVRMPFNGNITFHEITAVIPSSFIRDSTQSNDELWVFEKGNYKQCIILSRKPADEDVDTMLDNYVAYLIEEFGANAERGTYLYSEAVHSTLTRNGQFCQEILFVYHGYCYAVALRGGTEEEFQSLLNNVNTPDTINVEV